MSVIGVSPTDFVQFAKAINNIRNTYKNGPRKLSIVLDSLKELETQAQSLQSILEVANVLNCPRYGGFDKLATDLQNASLFLAKFKDLSTPTNPIRRGWDATILSLIKDGDLNEWKSILAEHRSRMEAYKTLLILNALYNNHHAGNELKSPTDIEDDNDKILRRALKIMQQRRQSMLSIPTIDLTSNNLSTVPSSASTLVTGSPEANKIYEEIASRAEELQLHYRDKEPKQDPEGWAEILKRLSTLVPHIGPSVVSTGSLLMPYTDSPEIMTRERDWANSVDGRGALSYIQIPSPTMIHELEGTTPTPRSLGAPAIQQSFLPDRSLIPDTPIVDELRSISTGGQYLTLADNVYVQCDKLSSQGWTKVKLEISQIENKTYIWVFGIDTASPSLPLRPSPRALTPADILSNRTSRSSPSATSSSLILKHIIFSQLESYPAVHHPAVEKSSYEIRFYGRQLVEIEGTSGNTQHWSQSLVYKFDDKSDRDELRSKIFGRRVLASAGYDNVRPAGACSLQTLTLWEDTRLGPDRRTRTYITLPCNSTGTQSDPDRTLLFLITGCKNLDAVKKKNERLTLEIASTPNPDQDSFNSTRRSSVVSSSTDSSNKSNRRRSSRADSFKIGQSRTCEILLTNPERIPACKDLKSDRKKLLSILKDWFEAG